MSRCCAQSKDTRCEGCGDDVMRKMMICCLGWNYFTVSLSSLSPYSCSSCYILLCQFCVDAGPAQQTNRSADCIHWYIHALSLAHFITCTLKEGTSFPDWRPNSPCIPLLDTFSCFNLSFNADDLFEFPVAKIRLKLAGLYFVFNCLCGWRTTWSN